MKVSKYFKLPEELKRRFEWLLDYFHLSASDVLTPMVKRWVEENEKQAKLDSFVKAENGTTINIIRSETVHMAVFQKAELIVAREELQRLLGILQRTQDPRFKHETKVQLAQALKKFEPVYRQTRDPELEVLIRQVEANFNQSSDLRFFLGMRSGFPEVLQCMASSIRS